MCLTGDGDGLSDLLGFVMYLVYLVMVNRKGSGVVMMGSPAGGAGGPDKARTFVLPDLYLSLSGSNSSLQTLLQQTLKHCNKCKRNVKNLKEM